MVIVCRSRKTSYHLIPHVSFTRCFFSGTPSLKGTMSGDMNSCYIALPPRCYPLQPPAKLCRVKSQVSSWTSGHRLSARTACPMLARLGTGIVQTPRLCLSKGVSPNNTAWPLAGRAPRKHYLRGRCESLNPWWHPTAIGNNSQAPAFTRPLPKVKGKKKSIISETRKGLNNPIKPPCPLPLPPWGTQYLIIKGIKGAMLRAEQVPSIGEG